MKKPYRKELTGKKNEIGSEIISFAFMKNKASYWNCRCICGKEFIVRGADFSNGHSSTCGCSRKNKKNPQTQQYKIKNLVGQQFGKLQVLEDTGKRDSSRCVIWKCKCDCGREAEISSHSLRNGTASCGQCRVSKGELAIAQLLLENNIPFETQKVFENFRFSDTDRKGYFDFFVNNQYVIEFDGIQHFDIRFGWNNPEVFQKNQNHDKEKNNWCKKNNIPIIRIPYNQLEQLQLSDLLLESSNFII